MNLSLLICTLPKRQNFLDRLLLIIEREAGGFEYPHGDDDRILGFYNDDDNFLWHFEILLDPHPTDSIGIKRNRLLQKAQGEYLAFIDDDDRVSDDYLELTFLGIERKPDACSLTGIITEDGKNPKKFIHSNKYNSWFEKEGIYYRNNNHLNCIKSSIAKQMRFPDISHGEDRSYSQQLLESGLIQKEHEIGFTTYFYDYRSKK